ncbi:hypothetical protein TKK_0013202 [Trichogramma kaykai]|uniref:G-protein coupled receptors family 1 profile domain-containing protein n=1 Tax=Trichogramma kaykai TaxID=54128 RepID=A0ABD2WJZ9_9HYME
MSATYSRAEVQRDYEIETTTDIVLYRGNGGEFFFNETSEIVPVVGANATEPLAEDEDWAPILRKILLGFVLGLIIIATVVGNILVVLAVFLVKKLRKPCNYLLVSLAVSDLCVAWLVMPLAMMYEIMGSWTFGSRACEVWVSFDVLSCTASILNLCMISVDRYYAISKPLEYGVKRTTRRMTFYTALVWIGAACVSLPPLLVLGNEYKVMKDYGAAQCGVSQNFYYQIYATIGAFYLPLCIMVTTYLRIFILARGIVIAEIRAQTHMDALCYVEVPTTTTSTSSRRAAAHASSGTNDQEDRSAYEKAATTTTTDTEGPSSMQSTAKSSIDGPLDQQPVS